MPDHTKLAVNRAYGFSLGNMIDAFTGRASANPDGEWIMVEEVSPGVFRVVDDSMTDDGNAWLRDAINLGFCEWDDEVEDLDAGDSDESQCFGMSNHLRWNDVDITPEELRAPSIGRLRKALGHVAFCAWCPGDI